MLYDKVNPDLKSSYAKNKDQMANLVSHTQLPKYGLKAGNVLDPKQMSRLMDIRSRRLSGENLKIHSSND
jgi:hypothetical protein